MKASDFEYDGQLLSDFGFMICNFGNVDTTTVADSQLTFNTVPTNKGRKWFLTDSNYETCLECTFQICKIPFTKAQKEMEITLCELRDIKRWLERNEFLKFKLIDYDEHYFEDFYFEGSFNVSQIEVGSKILGLELTLTTNRPFAIHEPVVFVLEWTDEDVAGWESGKNAIDRSIIDISDEIGYIYPKMTITCYDNGTFYMYNSKDKRAMVIRNCTKNEVITIDYPIIKSSLKSHNIANDFNYEFFRISNDYNDRKNEIQLELPCKIEIEYNPVVKVGI